MSSPVSKEQIEEIRSRVPIASIIGRVVKLERTGNALRGCCPFHGERNPSFHRLSGSLPLLRMRRAR